MKEKSDFEIFLLVYEMIYIIQTPQMDRKERLSEKREKSI